MNCISNAPSYAAAILRRASRILARQPQYGCSVPAWSGNCNGAFPNAALRAINSRFLVPSYRLQCYSSKSKKSKKTTSSKLKSSSPEAEAAPREKDAFFVVRKGDVVGVYRSFRDCQAQVGSSICDPPISIYKGYLLPKDTEDYLISRGLKDALYTIRAADLRDDLFGLLTPCPIQEPSPKIVKDKFKEMPREKAISVPDVTNWLKMNAELTLDATAKAADVDRQTCTLEFDGASKGNPGKAGAGAVLRSLDGNLICRLREGAGTATNNVAEYRAIILGLNYALKRGYTNIQVQGDSKLICMQVQGLWKVRNKVLSELWEQVNMLKGKFQSFEISHVLRALNSEADAQANKAVGLDGVLIGEDTHIEPCKDFWQETNARDVHRQCVCGESGCHVVSEDGSTLDDDGEIFLLFVFLKPTQLSFCSLSFFIIGGTASV
ncbi:hypothetical protein CRG98_023413 [Punica granatum]|uniref:RNase H type-1 domain-containing protein n=1 Tax=Punica granatum TaxID=22663 RepID=A0A2I0JIX6_PUNGR|nr:hypothetical protein CRG98_023413 [Punica granatum]